MTAHNEDKCNDEIKQFETMYLTTLQIGEKVDLYKIFRNGRVCVTKRSKIGDDGFVCPRFLREICVMKLLSNPPKALESHPGRNNVVRMLDIYSENGYLHYDMEIADGNLIDLKLKLNPFMIKEQILIDVSNGLQYLHELGFNHCDLSHSNIAYFDNTLTDAHTLMNSDWDAKSSRMFRFAIIDFGNSVHKNRPMTVEVSTCYTMSLEMIDAVMDLDKIDKILKTYPHTVAEPAQFNSTVPYIPPDITTFVETQTQKLRDTMVHKKSDIWSIGALSYYLHSFNHYVDADTIAQQRDMILKRSSDNLENLQGHQEFVSKTRMMLISDHKIRPVVYFSHHRKLLTQNSQFLGLSDTNCYSSKQSHDPSIKNQDQILHDHNHCYKEKQSYKYSLYRVIIQNIIDTMAVKNKKIFLLNIVDRRTMNDLTVHCFDIENKIIQNVICQIKKDIRDRLIKISIVNGVRAVRMIILWLISHLYINTVWSICDIVNYMEETYIMPNTNENVLKKIVVRISMMILEALSWNLERRCLGISRCVENKE